MILPDKARTALRVFCLAMIAGHADSDFGFIHNLLRQAPWQAWLALMLVALALCLRALYALGCEWRDGMGAGTWE